MSRNNQDAKMKRYKTSLIKPKGHSTYFAQNTLFNTNTFKMSIGQFNKSIDHQHLAHHAKPIVQSQNQTIKISKDNKKNKARHISSFKDLTNNPNAHTNYIINNFTLSAKNLINQGHTESNEISNKKKKEIERLNMVLASKEKEIDSLKQSLAVKETKRDEAIKRLELFEGKYSKLKEEYLKGNRKIDKLSEKVFKLEGNERRLRKMKEMVNANTIYIQSFDDNDCNNKEEEEAIVLLDLKDYIKQNDLELFQCLYFKEDDNTMTISNANESSVFTPLTIEPVKSLKRLDIIPKLNFNKLIPRSDSDDIIERSKEKKRGMHKGRNKHTISKELKEQSLTEREKAKRKQLSINVKPSNGIQKDYLNIQDSYREAEPIAYDKDNDNERFHYVNYDKSAIAKNANMPNNTLTSDKEENKLKNKSVFTIQNPKAKSFSRKLLQMVKNDINVHIQNKYNKLPHKLK